VGYRFESIQFSNCYINLHLRQQLARCLAEDVLPGALRITLNTYITILLDLNIIHASPQDRSPDLSFSFMFLWISGENMI